MNALIDYRFDAGMATNPDGSNAATVKDCALEAIDIQQPTWGRLRNALVFSEPSLVQLPVVERLAGLLTFTVEVVARPAAGGDRMNLVEGQTTPFALFLERAPDGGHVPVASIHVAGGGWRAVRGPVPVARGAWTHIAMSWTGEAVVLAVGHQVVARLPLPNSTLQPVGRAPIHVGKWVDGRRFPYEGALAALRIHDGIPPHLVDTIEASERNGLGEIDAKYQALGGPAGFLRDPTGSEHAVAGGRRRDYQGGIICWHRHTGAFEVHGAILQRYLTAGGPGGFLGFPATDELPGTRTGSRVSRFVRGGIWWSQATGAKEVHGEIYRKYLTLGAESGFLALPTTDERAEPGGRSSEFQGGVVYWSSATSAHEVHGAILARYRALGGPGSFVGFPTTDESDVRGASGAPTGGKLSRFAGATIYWSAATGAFEVHGAIRDFYEARGGPLSPMGYPLTNETGVAGSTHRYNDTQQGVIVWHPSSGAQFIGELELRLGMVRSGPIDDGIGDSSAELITYTTVRVDGQARETNRRRPDGHAGTSFDLNAAGARYRVGPVRGRTRIEFEIRIEDWDRISSNDYLGTFRRSHDIATLWGTAAPDLGTFTRIPMVHKGGDAPRLDSVTLDYSIAVTRPSAIDPTKHFREQRWWSFRNFSTAKLTQQQYADTFRDVGHRTNWWETITHPWDSLFYLAYEGLASKGNCVGFSIEAAYARATCSPYTMPIFRYPGNDANLRRAINEKHGYQIGDDHIRWLLAKLATLDAIRPLTVYDNVKRALAQGNWPVLSMFTLDGFSGHTVLPYRCQDGAPGSPHRIFVADPNVEWSRANGDATWVEVRRDNTFAFSSAGLTYRSSQFLGFLPTTVMYETPLSVVSSQPRTPFWEFTALLAALGGLVILAGDGTTSQLTADGAPLYAEEQGQRGIRPGGARGWLPMPSFDHQEPRELFVQSGQATDRLELSIRGSRTGRYSQLVRTSRAAFRLEGPSTSAGSDTVRLSLDRVQQPEAELTTSEASKTCTVGVAPIPRPAPTARPVFGASAELALVARETALVRGAAEGAGLVVRPAGPLVPVPIVIERLQAGRVDRTRMTVTPATAGETLQVRPRDPASPLGEVVIEHLTSPGGSVSSREIGTPRPM